VHSKAAETLRSTLSKRSPTRQQPVEVRLALFERQLAPTTMSNTQN
jgi:hypothetical protein